MCYVMCGTDMVGRGGTGWDVVLVSVSDVVRVCVFCVTGDILRAGTVLCCCAAVVLLLCVCWACLSRSGGLVDVRCGKS